MSASGHVLTERQLTDGCNVIVVSGHGDADRLTEDGAAELALLRVYGVTALVPAAFAAAVANALVSPIRTAKKEAPRFQVRPQS